MTQFFTYISLFTLLSACSTNTKVTELSSHTQAREGKCEVQFYQSNKPLTEYLSIGKIESHISKNFFFGGKAQLEDEAFEELRKKVCALGGDAVIIDDSIETSAAEMTHVHVWATVIKYTN